MTDLPADWTRRPLSEIADVRLGRQRSPKNHKGPQMRPYLRAANVGWAGLKLNDIKSMNFSDLEMGTYRLSPGDLVMSEASGSPGEVGKPALWSGELDECAFQNTLIRIRSYDVEPHYLLHYFRFVALTGGFAGHAPGVGIHHLGRARIAGWSTPVPPPDEQRRIVDILEDHLSRLDAALANLDLARSRSEGLLVAALLGDAHVHAARTEPLASLLAEPLTNGRSVPTHEGGFPVLRLTALRADGVDLAERKSGAWTESEAKPFLVRRGDFFVSRGNGSLRLVGRGAHVINDPDPVAYPDTLIRIRTRSEVIVPEYLHLVWNSPIVRRQLESMARTTAGIYKVNQKHLESVRIPVPDVRQQRAVSEHLGQVSAAAIRLQNELGSATQRGERLRRALMGAAFSGRLTGRSSDLDVDELAAASS